MEVCQAQLASVSREISSIHERLPGKDNEAAREALLSALRRQCIFLHEQMITINIARRRWARKTKETNHE
jgi:hypothetical protein